MSEALEDGVELVGVVPTSSQRDPSLGTGMHVRPRETSSVIKLKGKEVSFKISLLLVSLVSCLDPQLQGTVANGSQPEPALLHAPVGLPYSTTEAQILQFFEGFQVRI